MFAVLPDDVHAAITNRIAALVPTDGYSTSTANGYAHDANDAWRATDQPLVPELTPNAAAHLAFFVDDRNLDSVDGYTQDGELLVVAPATIRWLFQIRPYDQIRDWRGSARSGAALLAHLLADGWSGEFNIVPGNGQLMARSVVGDGEWLSCELQIRVSYAIRTTV